MLDGFKNSPRMPIIFAGHGSPMNAIVKNNFTDTLKILGNKIQKPNAIVMVSAHWMTSGITKVLGMDKPKMVYDMRGFPKELYEVVYPAYGNPELAKFIQDRVINPKIFSDLDSWGFDHGAWSVLLHMYPKADIPVVQLSLDMIQSPEYHFQIGQQLSKLRDQGVLIIGSGNLVHNLRFLNWETNANAFDWAIEFDEWIKKRLESRDFSALNKDFNKTEAGKLSVPSMDHYLPLQYVLGASDSQDELRFEFEGIQNASISMRTFGFWPRG